MANILRGAALFLGFSAMATFLLASGRGLVNVFLFLLLFVLLQAVGAAGSAFVMLCGARNSRPAGGTFAPARALLKRVFPDQRILDDCGPALRLLLLRYTQEMGTLFTAGAVAAFFVVLSFSDFTFVWGSTFGASDAAVQAFTDVLAAPWAAWCPPATVSAQLIAESRFHPAVTDFSQANLATLRGWWPFLIMAMLTYALLPRVLLWLVSRALYRRGIRRALLQFPGSDMVLSRMRAPVVRTQSPEDEGVEAGRRVWSAALDRRRPLINWAGALGAAEREQLQAGAAAPGAAVLDAGAGRVADDQQVLEQLNEARAEHLQVLVRAWEPPMGDLHDFLAGLRDTRRCTLFLMPLPGRPVAAQNLQDWREFARTLPLAVADVQVLER